VTSLRAQFLQAERGKRIELIEASKEAEVRAIGVKVEAEAEKEAASNRADAMRVAAEGEAESEKLRAEASRIRFEVEAAGQRAINEAANLLSSDQISLQTKLALLKVLPELVRESAKPLEAIDSIKIVQVDGITQNGGGGSGGGSSGNLATDAVAAALSYRAQAPVIDGLMKELGLDGSSLDKLVAGGIGYRAPVSPDLDDDEIDAQPKNKKIARPKIAESSEGGG
jgi:uncharacterized membrane protein YqiK